MKAQMIMVVKRMNQTEQSRTRIILDEAEDWLVILQSGNVSEFDAHRFQSWLNQDTQHLKVFEDLMEKWNRIPELSNSAAYFKLVKSVKPTYSSKLLWIARRLTDVLFKSSSDLYESYSSPKIAMVSTCFVLVSLLALLGVNLDPAQIESYDSAKGEITELVLSDGSQITLSADSALETHFTKAKRAVILKSGQAFFSVEKNEDRPFFVSAGETQIRVVGTQFDVRKSQRKIDVAVLEGMVEVSKHVTHENFGNRVSTTQLTLTRGQMISTENTIHSDFSPITSINIEDISPWISGRLRYNNANLEEITSDANRFYPHTIELADDDLATLKVTTSFKVDEIEKTLEDLALVLPIKIQKDDNRNIVITRAPDRL